MSIDVYMLEKGIRCVNESNLKRVYIEEYIWIYDE